LIKYPAGLHPRALTGEFTELFHIPRLTRGGKGQKEGRALKERVTDMGDSTGSGVVLRVESWGLLSNFSRPIGECIWWL